MLLIVNIKNVLMFIPR